jgi:hypothetical protein
MDVHFQGVFMSCTRRIAKLLSQATPYIEYLEEKVIENVSAASTAVINKGAEVLTKENAKKAYGSVQNVFASCRRKNKEQVDTNAVQTAEVQPVAEERRVYTKKLM